MKRKQIEINYDEVTVKGLTKGARQFLRETRRYHQSLYTSYSLHQRINYKANHKTHKDGILYVLLSSHRIYPDIYTRKQLETPDRWYAHMRLNRWCPLRFISCKDEYLFVSHGKKRPAHRSKSTAYTICMKTIGDLKTRYKLLEHYINTGVYGNQQRIR